MDNVEETSCNFPVAAEPTSVALLRRHASPFPRVTEETKHRLEIRRILRDSATQVPHAVPGQGEERSRHEEVDNGWFQRYWKKLAPQLSTVAFWKSLLKHVRPFQQYTDYSLSTFLRKDLVAGCTVAIMAMPLGMSYAQLAGLPPYYGLYSTFVPPIIFPIFGSSRQLAVGPAALTSLLLGPALISIVTDEGLTDTSSAEYLARYAQLAVQCSFLAGLINIGMGLFRLGFLTQFLSRALISGFITGAAVILICSQIKHLFGYPIPSSNRIQNLIKSLAQGIGDFNWKTFTIGSICLAVLLTVKFASQNKRISEKYPSIKWLRALAPFIVSAVMIALTFGLDLEDKGIPIVANIPSGLPTASVSQWTPVSSKLFTVVISMVVVGFVQSISISKRFAYKHSYEIDSSQELVGLGMANLIGGMFQAFPVTGAMGQSAVNDDIGAETGVASIVTGFFVMIVLVLLTSVFEKMPLSVLAAIVITFVSGMFDFKEAVYLYKVHKFDFAVWMAAFLGTLFLGVEYGLVIAVAVSLLIVIYESAYPHTAVLGRLPGTSLYRNIKQYPLAERYEGLVIVRIDAPLYFANAQNVRDKIRKYKRVAADDLALRNAGEVRYIILDLSPVSHIDTTGLHVLEDMYLTQEKLGVQLCLCNPGISVMERLLKSGMVDLVGRDHFFSDVINAVQWCLNEMDCAGSQSEEGLYESVSYPPAKGEEVRVDESKSED